jgi:hypothetical protein
LLAVAQAQKELTHNEALALIDALLFARCESLLNMAPTGPLLSGQCWLIDNNPTGIWAGRAGSIALWTDGGWRYIAPVAGMQTWCVADQGIRRWNGSQWLAPPSIGGITGGTVIDSEARAALLSLSSILADWGLVSLS